MLSMNAIHIWLLLLYEIQLKTFCELSRQIMPYVSKTCIANEKMSSAHYSDQSENKYSVIAAEEVDKKVQCLQCDPLNARCILVNLFCALSSLMASFLSQDDQNGIQFSKCGFTRTKSFFTILSTCDVTFRDLSISTPRFPW